MGYAWEVKAGFLGAPRARGDESTRAFGRQRCALRRLLVDGTAEGGGEALSGHWYCSSWRLWHEQLGTNFRRHRPRDFRTRQSRDICVLISH